MNFSDFFAYLLTLLEKYPYVPPTPAPPAPPVVPAPVPAPVPPVVPVAPTFSDDFSAGHLDTSKWQPSNWSAPGTIAGVHKGTFSSSALDFSYGCLRLRVQQIRNADGSVSSQGGELCSRQTFGYGTYEWIIRVSSTSTTPEGRGRAVSGQISSAFIYKQDGGYTEIDAPEIEGQFPNQLEYTSYLSVGVNSETNAQELAPEAGFHSYKTIWSPGDTKHYYDGVLVSEHKTDVPTMPAYAMINHWGTNSKSFGGLATPGVDRYLFVKRFSFTPA